MPARIHIIGRKNSGKTTLVVELVAELSRRGYRVGTVKHTHHHHELDTPGKDSFRHREAGAAVVGILAPGMTAVFKPCPSSADSNARYAELEHSMADCDLLLVEGDTHAEAPRIEVWRAVTCSAPLASDDPSILALVTDDPVEVSQPVWRRSDVAGLADKLLQRGDIGPR